LIVQTLQQPAASSHAKHEVGIKLPFAFEPASRDNPITSELGIELLCLQRDDATDRRLDGSTQLHVQGLVPKTCG
jgi:hypothetical protein